MNYSEIIHELDKATAFDLFRLSAAIKQMLDEPARLTKIKQSLLIGMQIEYFDPASNQVTTAIVEKMNRTRVAVRDIDSGKSWTLPYHWINIHKVDTTLSKGHSQQGLSRAELHVGELVGFIDRNNIEQYAKVVRLNQKTASVTQGSDGWRVPYSMLFKVMDGEADEVSGQKNITGQFQSDFE